MKKSGKKILTGTAAAMLALSAVAAPVATVVTNPSETKAAAVRFTDVRLVMIGGQLYVQASYNTYNVKEQITVGIVPEYGPTQGIAVVTPDSSKQSLIPVTKKIVAGDRIFVLFIGSNGVQIDGVVLAADEFMDIQAISNAEAAINNLFTTTAKTAIKSTTNQAAINSAQLLVNEVLNDTKRAALQQDINKAQQLLNARTESDNQAAARTAVNQLFINNTPISNAIKDTTTQASINAARALVNKVTDAAVRNALEADLKKAQDLLDYNANQQINQAAQTAVNELFKDNQPATGAIKDTTTQATIDAAQKLVDAVKDQSLKNTLQENINKAKDLLTDGGAQTKAREAVNNLFGNKDPKGNIKAGLTQAEITNAQSLVDKVSDAVKKAELQADLDKAKKEFNQTGTDFTYTFKNRTNDIFATMNISITNMQAVTTTKAVLTGSGLYTMYASILIQDAVGTAKFDKQFLGYNAETTQRAYFSIGDFITTYHSEFNVNRLSIQNNTNKGELEVRETITYMVTAKGLVLVSEAEKETVIAENKAREVVNSLFKNKDPKGDITAEVTQADIQNAQSLVDAVQDLTKRAELQSDLNKAKAQLDAKIKADQERQAAADKAINELFKDNKPSTGEIKDTTNQQAIDDAQKLVDVVEDVTAKKELQANLDKVKELLDAKIAAEKAANEAAKKLVDELFTNDNPATNAIKAITNQQAINDAKAAVAKVTDPALKATLEENIELAQKLLNERTILEEEDKGQQLIASFLVKQLYQNNDPKTDAIKSATNQVAINTAQEQVDLIRDPEVRAQLQKEVDRAQELLNARLQAEDEANQAAADKAVNELFKDNKPSTGEIKDTTDQASIDAAQKAIDAVKDPVVKDALQANLDKAQELLNAKKAEEKAEQDRQNAADKAVNELFKDNKPATGTIKDTTNQDAIDAAQKVIDAVKDQATKDALQANLDKAQELLNAKKAEEKAEQDRQNAADKAINELFKDNNPATGEIKDTTDQTAIDEAQKIIDKVTDPAVKQELQNNLDKAQELLNEKNSTEKEDQATANKAVNELFKDNDPKTGAIKDTTNQDAIDAAQKLIDAVKDPETNAALQANLDKAQELLDAKTAADKAEQARQVAAEKAVNELFNSNKPSTGIIKDATDQTAIDAAQKLIDAVTVPSVKKELQANLDKAQNLLDTKFFNAAQEAVQGLMTTLVSFGQKTDAYGAIKLDTTQEKIYQAQDKVSLVPDRVAEKANLIAQLDKVQEQLIARNNEQIGNKVNNGNFDSALNGWKTWIGSGSVAPTVAATEGPATKTVKLASNSSVEQTIQGLRPNTNYVITFYGKVDDGTFLSAGIKNHGNTQQSIRVTTADYSKGQIAFTTGASATSATFFLMKGAGTGNGFGDFVISKADNGEDLIPEVIEATNKVDNLFTNLSVTGVNDTTATLYKNGALKLAVKQADIDAAMAVVNAMQDSYESKADLLATLKTAQDLWNDRTVEQTDNLVKNSEFDSSIANWKPWNGATSTTPVTVKEDGNNVLKLAGSSSVEQVISGLKPNTTYTLEIYGKADNNGYVSVGVKNYGGTQKTTRVSGADYTKASVTIRTGATNTTATVFLLKGAGISAGSVDTVLFKDSTPESERPEVIAANEALTALFTSRTSVSTEFLTPVTTNNGAIKMTTTEEDLAAATAAVEAVPTGLKSKAIFEAELARATTLFTALKASQTDNLTKNGAFDTNLTSWKTWKAATAETPVVVTENDNRVLKLEGNSSVEQTITGLLPNTTYTVSTYGKVENGARLSVGVKSYGGVQANAFVTSTDYGQGTLTFTTGATNTSAIIFLSQGVAGGIAYADLVVTK
ncbi:toxin Cry1Ac domain D-VI-related protein [Listeria booriae]|uniref:toxin Cry1Ac domain D-VI-related protein n=1 Tax=Listeria booriae TaxID=1552123 RepID=UPI00162742A0|nr:toxin Cry1Ac domain D-VI-related protein [Listeria booriae]MBC2174597.1 hypothetical protein [Listeria booriae]